jgi:hypothetical protein
VDRDRAPEDPGSNHHDVATSIASHRRSSAQADRVCTPPRSKA